jgi:transaldolase
MDFWLASANLKQIEKYWKVGIFKGVITNPHVVAVEKKEPKKLFREICEIADIAYYQIDDGTADRMLRDAHDFIAINPDKMRVKVPATLNGFEVISSLSKGGSFVMATCVPTRTWMIYAAAAGAKAAAPYSGMIQRAGISAKTEEVIKMQYIIDAQKLDLEICTGIYDVTEIPLYASHGIGSCFIWEKDVDKYLTQPLVHQAVEEFKSDWEGIKKSSK